MGLDLGGSCDDIDLGSVTGVARPEDWKREELLRQQHSN